MLKNHVIKFLFTSFIVSCGLFFLPQNNISADMPGMQGHQHHMMQPQDTTQGEEVIAGIKTEPEKLTTGAPATIVFSLKDREGKPLEGLVVHHDRLLHVVISSQDFSEFAHIHPDDFVPVTPEMKKTATYPVRFTFPKAGRYIIGIDFAAKDRMYSRHFLVDVAGGHEMGAPVRELTGKKHFGDLDVTFSSLPERITAGKEVTLTYLFSKDGKPATDLEPYLSAPMHLAIISSDLTRFIHTHGELPGVSAMEHHGHDMKMNFPFAFGPEIDVHVVFPARGLYQIFGQVGHGGKVITTSFMVEVE